MPPLARAAAHWLLELDVHGRVYRWAEAPVSVATVAGDTLRYAEGLDADLTLPLVEEGTLSRRVQLRVEDDTDWPLLESRGQSPHRAPAVLRWWREGQTLEDARVVIRGLALVSSVGVKGEGLSLTITRDPSIRPRYMLPAGATARNPTWPVRGTTSLAQVISGQYYPLVIGYPGDDGSAVPEPVVPALMVEYSPGIVNTGLLLGLGRLEIGASGARIHNATLGAESSYTTVQHTEDDLGRAVTLAYLPGGGALGTPRDAYYCGYASGWVGGIRSPFRAGVLRTATDVIRWALLRSGRQVDDARIASYAPILDRYRVDTYVNRPLDYLEWLEAAVLSWLPVIVAESGDGIYVRPIQYDATAEDAVAHLIEGQGVERVGQLQRLDDDPVNEVTVEFRKGRDNAYLGRITLTAQAGALSGDDPLLTTTDAEILPSARARRSQSYYGEVYRETVTLDHTWDRSTALLVAETVLARRAVPRRAVSYEGGSELDSLMPGDVVIVTDAELYLSEAPAIVGEVTLAVDAAVVTLILLDTRSI